MENKDKSTFSTCVIHVKLKKLKTTNRTVIYLILLWIIKLGYTQSYFFLYNSKF